MRTQAVVGLIALIACCRGAAPRQRRRLADPPGHRRRAARGRRQHRPDGAHRAQHLSQKFGQTFVVENQPSAGGALGTGQVATAAPDGYTILFSPSSMLNLAPLVQKVSFEPDKQLTPVINVGTGTQVIAIKPQPAGGQQPGRVHRLCQSQSRQAQFAIAGARTI